VENPEKGVNIPLDYKSKHVVQSYLVLVLYAYLLPLSLAGIGRVPGTKY
jgi:hypothetical protein